MKLLFIAALATCGAFAQTQPTTFIAINYSSTAPIRAWLPAASAELKPQVQFFIQGPPTAALFKATVFYGDNKTASAFCSSSGAIYTLCVVEVDAAVIARAVVQVFSQTEQIDL